MMVTVSLEEGQVPLLVVHTKRLAPLPKEVTPEVGELGVVTTPFPLKRVQFPVPTNTVFPARVVKLLGGQMF